MLLEIGVVKRPEDVGYYSGFIESVYSITGVLAGEPTFFPSPKFGEA
jgi:hypothetical protein